MKSKKLIKTITKWLKEEIAYGQPVVDGQEQLSDGTEDIIIGRHGCAEGLLAKIKQWEREVK
jgi:hypothetical protein